MNDLKKLLEAEALRLGFSYCGFARCESLEALRPFYNGFIRRKNYTGMNYLETQLEKRLNPALLLDGARSVMAVLLNYYPQQPIPSNNNYIIASYAYGKDYHTIMRARMKLLEEFTGTIRPGTRIRSFVDSGPVMEKVWAQRCGAGWQGKNTLLISPTGGSFFFIGIFLTDQELEPDTPGTDRCGSCQACVSACPTGALDTPYQLDIGRCISYHTIENHDDIPESLKEKLNDRIYGCDICQEVCPYNRFARPHNIPEFIPTETLVKMRKTDWKTLSEPGFDILFGGSAVKRRGYGRFRRTLGL